MYDANERVQRGAVILDRVQPDWRSKINLSDLEMSSNNFCVLGQLFDGYQRGVERLTGAIYNIEWSESNGFTTRDGDWNSLNVAWETEIRNGGLAAWERELLYGNHSQAEVDNARVEGIQQGRAEGITAYQTALVKIDEAQSIAGLGLNMAQVMRLTNVLTDLGAITL